MANVETAPDGTKGKWIITTYFGYCKGCKEKIHKGDPVLWVKGTGMYCRKCAGPTGGKA